MRRKLQKLIILVPIIFIIEKYMSHREIVNNLVSIKFMRLKKSISIENNGLLGFGSDKDIDYYFKFNSKIIKPHCSCSNIYKEYIIIEKNGQQLDVNLVRESIGANNFFKTKQKLYNLSTNELKSFNIACDLYNVLKRGKNQKIVAYSLYGNEPKYTENLKKIIEQVRKYYAQYFVRIFYDSTINQTLRCHLECKYEDIVDFCNVNRYSHSLSQLTHSNRFLDLKYMHKMMWRFLPIGDTFVDLFLCRDTDSYITDREVHSVKEWLFSNNIGHIMRGKGDIFEKLLAKEMFIFILKELNFI